MVALQVQLNVRTSKAALYRDYEEACLRIMSRYQGRLLVAFRPDVPAGEAFIETHILTFPDEESFRSYLSDPDRAALQPQYSDCILETRVTRGQLVSYS